MAEPLVTVGQCPSLTPAQLEDERLQLVYDMRDALVERHQFEEALATEVAELCVQTLASVEDGELLATKRAVRRQLRRQRDRLIRAEARTGNAEDVAKRWNLSVTRVYEIWAAR